MILILKINQDSAESTTRENVVEIMLNYFRLCNENVILIFHGFCFEHKI